MFRGYLLVLLVCLIIVGILFMAKVTGFRSQEVYVERKETPDSDPTTSVIPPSWVPLMDKIARFYDNQMYAVVSPFQSSQPRERAEKSRAVSYLPTIRQWWAGLTDEEKEDWKDAAAFVKKNGYQLFVKDCALRIIFGMEYQRTPSIFYPTYGLLMYNLSGAYDVNIKYSSKPAIGPIVVSFNYVKVQYAPPVAMSFRVRVRMFFKRGGKNYYHEDVFYIPDGDVDWTSFSESCGQSGKKYYLVEVYLSLSYYDADVYLANFLIQDYSPAWTVEYKPTTLPNDASPAWTPSGSLSEVWNTGSCLYMREVANSSNTLKFSRTPEFDNSLGSSVEVRLMIEGGTEKDSGASNHVFEFTHCDGVRKAEYRFFTNGFIIKTGGNLYKYHGFTNKFITYKSFIRGNRLYFYAGKILVHRGILEYGSPAEVSFAHFGRDDYNTGSVIRFVRYYQGLDSSPTDDILREGWWILAGKSWTPEIVTRGEGWAFEPEYSPSFFQVVYLG